MGKGMGNETSMAACIEIAPRSLNATIACSHDGFSSRRHRFAEGEIAGEVPVRARERMFRTKSCRL